MKHRAASPKARDTVADWVCDVKSRLPEFPLTTRRDSRRLAKIAFDYGLEAGARGHKPVAHGYSQTGRPNRHLRSV